MNLSVNSLRGAFHKAKLDYDFEKVMESIHDRGSRPDAPSLAEAALRDIEAAVERFLVRLRDYERDPFHKPIVVAGQLAPIRYAINQLRTYIQGEPSDIPNHNAAAIYGDFLRAKMALLEGMAEEVDLNGTD